MKCPSCRVAINIKKNQVITCSCGSKLMAIEINKKLIINKVN